ncbi:MAG: hypothetical protein ACHP7O_01035 [Burkholderiales bacterium]
MLGKTNNPLLQQTEQAVQAKVSPQMQNTLQRAVVAGLTVMYSPQSHQIMLAQLTKPGDPAQNVAEGVAKLIGVLYRQSRSTMPIPIMIPAAMILMCEGLDFLSKANGTQITPQLVAQCTQDVGQFMLKLLGISQQQMHQVVAHGMSRAHQRMQGRQAALQPSGGIIDNAMIQGAQ